MTHSDFLKIKVIVKDTTGNVDDKNRQNTHKSIYLYSETFLIKISLKPTFVFEIDRSLA